MKKSIIFLMMIVTVFLSCKGDGKNNKNKDQSTLQDSKSRLNRRKISNLDPKTFIEIQLDLGKESRKWQDILRKKRNEYFASYGITEQKFYQYSMRNRKNIMRFLKDNPKYEKLMKRSLNLHR
ncbi:MAG: hypothetical protein KAS64_04050 [Spirochaetes bacterium]|nr:hypothetical protein [Spirochaetota bacterium]